MRQDRWSDDRIIFWDEVYKVASKGVDKSVLRRQDEKPAAINKELEELGENIRRARKHKGFTQHGLADKAGVSQQTISFVERGNINASFMTLKKLADILGLKIRIEYSDEI